MDTRIEDLQQRLDGLLDRLDTVLAEREELYKERHLFIIDIDRRRQNEEIERMKAALRLRDEQLSKVQEELRQCERRRGLYRPGKGNGD